MANAKLRTMSFGFKRITITAGIAQPLLTNVDDYFAYRFATDFKAVNLISNVGNVYIGDSTVDNTWDFLEPGSSENFTHGNGTLLGCDAPVSFDLSKIYIDGDNDGDIVIIKFLRGEINDVS